MRETYTITLPLPHKHLSPNARPHWRAKAMAVKVYRSLTGLTATGILTGQANLRPMWKAATVQGRAFFKDARRRDKDNILASLKAAFDGLKDAGLIEDDSGLTHLPMEVLVDKKNPRIELVVTKQPDTGEEARA